MGLATGIDPSKPGYGPFGPAMYDDRSLKTVTDGLSAPIRHKRAAIARTDEGTKGESTLSGVSRERLELLARARIGGVVFDYDGTLVATSERRKPLRQEIVEQLVRLGDAGGRIGIATGRGGSAGEGLRDVLPERMHPSVIVGYYNGSHLAALDVDLKTHPAASDPVIAEVADWLRAHTELFVSTEYEVRGLQITIDAELLRYPQRFRRDLLACPPISDGRAKVTGSGHSFDVVPAGATKLHVVDEIKAMIGEVGRSCASATAERRPATTMPFFRILRHKRRRGLRSAERVLVPVRRPSHGSGCPSHRTVRSVTIRGWRDSTQCRFAIARHTPEKWHIT
jgi:hypothetical protein